MASFLLVKKYNNRKLYIPDEKNYTNLKRLSKEVLNNKKIICTMVPSGTDNTKNTLIDILASFIFENGQKLSNEYIYNLIHVVNKQLNKEVQNERNEAQGWNEEGDEEKRNEEDEKNGEDEG